MPSPFRRKSGQIQPMSQAELDASAAKLKGQALQDQFKHVFIARDPSDGDKWIVAPSPAQSGAGMQDGSAFSYASKADAELAARAYADEYKVPYLGER